MATRTNEVREVWRVTSKDVGVLTIKTKGDKTVEIDIAAISQELDQLSPDQLKQQLLDAKVKQKVNTKKYYNAETAKAARQKKSKQLSLMAEKAKSLPATLPGFANLYEQINAEATEAASRKLGEQEAEDAAALAAAE